MSLKEIKNTIQHDRIVLDREPTCRTTHSIGCDCQVQRHVREKVELLELLSLSTEREERYRKALDEITKLNTEGVTKASIIARTALDEGEEVK